MGFDAHELTCYYGPMGNLRHLTPAAPRPAAPKAPSQFRSKAAIWPHFKLNGVPDHSPSVRGPDSKWNKWSRMKHFFGLASSLRPANHPKSLASFISRDPGFSPARKRHRDP